MIHGASESADPTGLTIVTRPNCSLSGAGRVLFFCVILLLSSIVAGGMAVVGAWLVLPFSGLEVLALGWALYHISCHSADYECIVVDGGRVLVETRSHKTVQKVELQRYWARIVILPATAQGRCRIWLRSRDQEVELGKFVDDDGRMDLARRLEGRIGAGFKG